MIRRVRQSESSAQITQINYTARRELMAVPRHLGTQQNNPAIPQVTPGLVASLGYH